MLYNVLGATIISAKLKAFDLTPEMLFKVNDITRRATPKSIDRLIIISRYNKPALLKDSID